MKTETLKVETTDAGSVAASIGADVPSDDQASPDITPVTETPPPEAEKGDSRVLLDDKGNAHNPDIHASPPKKTGKGVWAKKKGRKKATRLKVDPSRPAQKSFVASPSYNRQQAELSAREAQTVAARQADNKGTAVAVTNAVFALGQAVGGPKFAPGAMVSKTGLNRSQETAYMQDNFYGYFESTGKSVELPAWAGLGIALGMYGASRIGEKDVQAHAKRSVFAWFSPVGKWWKRRKDKQEAKKALKREQKEKTGEQPINPDQALDDLGFSGAEGFA